MRLDDISYFGLSLTSIYFNTKHEVIDHTFETAIYLLPTICELNMKDNVVIISAADTFSTVNFHQEIVNRNCKLSLSSVFR